MHEAFIGILTALAAVVAWAILRPSPAAGLPPPVWQVSAGQVAHPDDSPDLPAAPRPPAATTSAKPAFAALPGDRL